MMSPTTARGLLGNFLHGADPPAADQNASPPPVQSPTSSSLRAILAAEARGRGAKGGAGEHKGLRDGGRGVGGKENETGTGGERRKARRGRGKGRQR